MLAKQRELTHEALSLWGKYFFSQWRYCPHFHIYLSRLLFLSWTRWIQSTPSYLAPLRSVLYSPVYAYVFKAVCLLQVSLSEPYVYFSFPVRKPHAPPSLSVYYVRGNVWREVPIMELFVMHFSSSQLLLPPSYAKMFILAQSSRNLSPCFSLRERNKVSNPSHAFLSFCFG
jgi:hypothetical protein